MTFNPVITFSDHHTTTDTTSKCKSENQNIQAANSPKIKLRRVVSYGGFNTEGSAQYPYIEECYRFSC